VPREAEEPGPNWPWGPDGRVAVPTAAWKAAAPEPLRGRARPLLNLAVDWEEDWPVFSVSWEDAMAYALWRSRKAGRLFTLPHEAEWEKAARGVDGRWFPCGFEDDATFSNTNLTFEDGMRPAPVDSFPADESPCGARGMEGNASDHCLNDPGDPYPGWRIFRGGAFLYTDFYLRAARRGGGRSTMPGYHCSIRLCFRVQPAASAKGLTREE
jgi:formylglycine-generating enzyme required for sulfatase activity